MAVRLLVLASVTVTAVVFTATAALAHASLQQASVPAGTEQTLTLRVPDERDATASSRVDVRVPAAFTVVDCNPPDGWTCTVAEPSDEGTVVAYGRAEGTQEDVMLDVRVTAPAEAGTYVLPTIQTYDDGEEVAWVQTEDGADRPAPTIEVTAGSEEVADAPVASPHGDATAEPSPTATTPAGPATADDAPTAAPDDDQPATPDDEAAASQGDPTTDEAAADGGPGAVPIILTLVVVAVVAAVAFRFRRTR